MPPNSLTKHSSKGRQTKQAPKQSKLKQPNREEPKHQVTNNKN